MSSPARSYPAKNLAGMFFCLVTAMALLGCSRTRKIIRREPDSDGRASGVSNAQKSVPVYLKGLGNVTASNTVSVKSRVDGQLSQVNFKEGQSVKKGDPLEVIDPRPFQVALEHGTSQFVPRSGPTEGCPGERRPVQKLIRRFRSDFQAAGGYPKGVRGPTGRSSPRGTGLRIENAKLNLVYTHITSPINGRVGLRLVDVGNMVHAADTNPLLVITQLQPIAVISTLPEENLPTVSKHMHPGPLSVKAYSSDDQTKIATGYLLTIDNQIHQTTGTGRLKAMFTNQDNVLWPNQFVNVRLLLETHERRLIALCRDPDWTARQFCIRRHAGQDRAVRPVTVSFTQNNVASIASGSMLETSWLWTDRISPRPAAKPIRTRVVTRMVNRRDADPPLDKTRRKAPSHRKLRRLRGRPARQATGRRHPLIQEHDEPVTTFHSSAGRDDPADGRAAVGGHGRLHAAPVSALPEVDYPTIQVVTFYPGADPGRHGFIGHRSAGAPVWAGSGLSQMTSTSSLGSSIITLQFNLNENIDVEEQQVQAAINSGSTYLADRPAESSDL